MHNYILYCHIYKSQSLHVHTLSYRYTIYHLCAGFGLPAGVGITSIHPLADTCHWWGSADRNGYPSHPVSRCRCNHSRDHGILHGWGYTGWNGCQDQLYPQCRCIYLTYCGKEITVISSFNSLSKEIPNFELNV